MKILSPAFENFLNEVISNGIQYIWISDRDNKTPTYIEEYAHCNSAIYEINNNLVIQTKSEKYYELMHGYANGQYAVEINELNIESIESLKLFYGKPISYSRFAGLSDLNIKSIKPELQVKITDEIKLKSISFYSEKKFEFGVIGSDNLKTHRELDRPLFDGCWLVLDKEMIEMNK